MQESLSDLQFSLSPRAFFQLNPQETVKLYESVRGAGLTGKETVIDAYCGTGTIGPWLAPYAQEVRGIETIPEAVEDAKANARRNGRANASFHVGQAEELPPRWVKEGMKPDVIIADPPRTGLDSLFLETVLRTAEAVCIRILQSLDLGERLQGALTAVMSSIGCAGRHVPANKPCGGGNAVDQERQLNRRYCKEGRKSPLFIVINSRTLARFVSYNQAVA